MKRIMIIVVLVATALLATGCTNYVNPGGTQVLVVEGDDVKDRSIQDVLCPGGGAKDIGLDNKARRYHHADSARYYNVTTEDGKGDRPGADQVRVETAEGMVVGIEFIASFNTNFDCKGEGLKLLKKFHTNYGNRGFPVLGEGNGTDSGVTARVYQGDRGWGGFLDLELRQKAIDPIMKDAFKPYACRDLSTTCAAMQNSAKLNGQALATAEDGRKAAASQSKLEEDLVTAINKQLKRTMGEQYLEIKSLDITAINLPEEMEASVRRAQVAATAVGETRAASETERIKAEAALDRAKTEAATKKLESQQFTSAQRLELAIAQARGCGRATNCTVINGEAPAGVRVEG